MKPGIWIIVIAVVLVGVGIWIIANPGSKEAPVQTNTENTNQKRSDYYVLEVNNYKYSPPSITAGASQTIKIELNNRDRIAHSLVFRDLDFRSSPVEAGETLVLTLTTPSTPGTYTFDCGEAGHAEQGMTGELIVQ